MTFWQRIFGAVVSAPRRSSGADGSRQRRMATPQLSSAVSAAVDHSTTAAELGCDAVKALHFSDEVDLRRGRRCRAFVRDAATPAHVGSQ